MRPAGQLTLIDVPRDADEQIDHTWWSEDGGSSFRGEGAAEDLDTYLIVKEDTEPRKGGKDRRKRRGTVGRWIHG